VSDDVEECLLPGKGDPLGLCMSPDGRFLAVAYARDLRDALLQVWQIDGSSARCLLDGRALTNEYCGFTRDNGRFVYESISRLNVLDLASGVVKRWPLPGVRDRPASRLIRTDFASHSSARSTSAMWWKFAA
jgi:hypothetical protein